MHSGQSLRPYVEAEHDDGGRTGARRTGARRTGALLVRAEQTLATMPKSKIGECIEPARSGQSLGSALNHAGEQKSNESMQVGISAAWR